MLRLLAVAACVASRRRVGASDHPELRTGRELVLGLPHRGVHRRARARAPGLPPRGSARARASRQGSCRLAVEAERMTLPSLALAVVSAPVAAANQQVDTRVAVIWVVAFVVVTVAITGFTGRVGWSAPIALILVGTLVSLIPGVPRIGIDPELVLYGVIPPLLFAAAIRTSVRDVRARNDSILALSVGLVAFTVVAVGFVAWALMPAIGLAAAFALGAVVAPTDAVAVSAVAGRIPLPRRLVTVLEGESLLNDATALVALNAAIVAIISVVNPWLVVGDFVLAVVGGVAVGFAVGWVLALIRKQLK